MDPVTAAGLILREIKNRTDGGKLSTLYPDTGPLRRELYAKYLESFKAGKIHQERAILGGNRVGKTLGIGGFETACHLTGFYPPWWEGHVIDHPGLFWAAGTKSAKVRDVNQKMLLGELHRMRGFTQARGGLIPSRSIGRLTRKTGISDAVDQVVVKHRKGWENLLTFKSYEEGRPSFEAEAVDYIWLDEEPPKPIYDECKMRILTTDGRILSTFTPVEGMTEVVLSLLEGSDLLAAHPGDQDPEPESDPDEDLYDIIAKYT